MAGIAARAISAFKNQALMEMARRLCRLAGSLLSANAGSASRRRSIRPCRLGLGFLEQSIRGLFQFSAANVLVANHALGVEDVNVGKALTSQSSMMPPSLPSHQRVQGIITGRFLASVFRTASFVLLREINLERRPSAMVPGRLLESTGHRH